MKFVRILMTHPVYFLNIDLPVLLGNKVRHQNPDKMTICLNKILFAKM